jgi:predicted nucleic acid-binding protein
MSVGRPASSATKRSVGPGERQTTGLESNAPRTSTDGPAPTALVRAISRVRGGRPWTRWRRWTGLRLAAVNDLINWSFRRLRATMRVSLRVIDVSPWSSGRARRDRSSECQKVRDAGTSAHRTVDGLAECLVGPARRSTRAVELVRTAIGRLPASVVPPDEEIATRSAALRARHRTLKLPDALVIATAETTGADRLITTDRKWPTSKAMKLAVAIEHL